MSNDIFNFNAEFKDNKIVTAREMKLEVSLPGGTGTTDYLVQNVAIQYARPIQIIRELSTGNLYYHALPPQGTLSVARIVGTNPITAILGTAGQGVWTAPSGAVASGGGAGIETEARHIVLGRISGGNTPRYEMFGCIVENFGTSTDANSSFVQENVSIRFGRMSVKGG